MTIDNNFVADYENDVTSIQRRARIKLAQLWTKEITKAVINKRIGS